jgi:hypothetical protein
MLAVARWTGRAAAARSFMRTTAPEIGLGPADRAGSGEARGPFVAMSEHGFVSSKSQSPKTTTRCPKTGKPSGVTAVRGVRFPGKRVPPYLARFLLTAPAVQSTHTSPASTEAPTSEVRPSNVIALPLILLLGCDAELAARCRSIAARSKVLVRSSPVPFARSEVTALAPLVIVVPADIYEGAPWGFEVLAEKVGASLLMLEREPIAPIVLEYRIMEALVFATRLRARVREAKQAMDGRR